MDLGQVTMQYRQAEEAILFLSLSMKEIEADGFSDDNEKLGGWLRTLAGLLDPRFADYLDSEFINQVPILLVSALAPRRLFDPGFAERLLDVAKALEAEHRLLSGGVETIKIVLDSAKDIKEDMYSVIIDKSRLA